MTRPRVLSAIMFFPRGGSAFVVRALARGLEHLGWDVTVVAGSCAGSEHADATNFYAGLDVRPVDFAPALASGNPLSFVGGSGTAPLHPSYEDRNGAPDRVFAALDDADYERQVQAWADALHRSGAVQADVLHLHHLTPIYEAARRVAPAVPVVGHLHGTELLMLERIEEGPPRSWTHAGRWAQRLRSWAAGCERLIVAPGGESRAAALLGVEPERLLTLPNGFDPEQFAPVRIDRRAMWNQHLVRSPRGWRPGGGPGSVSYRESDLDGLSEAPVLVSVGRFTEVKRLGLLIEAYGDARSRFDARAPLVLIGGYPGEWEGEHPADVVDRLGVPDVFLAGWHDQRSLPELLAGADVIVMPSAREHFGQVLVEAMGCGLVPVAARSPGPEEIVQDGVGGWLVPIDDRDALADALVEAVNDPAERRRRAQAARRRALECYSWPAVARRLNDMLEQVIAAPVSAGEPPELPAALV